MSPILMTDDGVSRRRNRRCQPASNSAASEPFSSCQCSRSNELVGTINIYRQEVRPFTDKQIELVTELRRAGRDRDREHAAAQRAA